MILKEKATEKHMRSLSVFVVEDDEVTAQAIQNKLLGAGHKVKHFSRATELARYTTERPDVIILDYFLPKIDGITTLHFIKEVYGKAKVIVFSKQKDVKVVHQFLGIGVYKYIPKSLTGMDELLEEIKKISQDKENAQDHKKFNYFSLSFFKNSSAQE